MTGGSRSVPPASDQYSPPPFFPILLNNQLPARNIPSFFNNTIPTKTSHPPNMKLKKIFEPTDQPSNLRFEFPPIMSSILEILEAKCNQYKFPRRCAASKKRISWLRKTSLLQPTFFVETLKIIVEIKGRHLASYTN